MHIFAKFFIRNSSEHWNVYFSHRRCNSGSNLGIFWKIVDQTSPKRILFYGICHLYWRTLKITLPLTKVTSHLGSTTCWYWILILKCPTVNWFPTFFLPFFERKTRMALVVIYCNLNKFIIDLSETIFGCGYSFKIFFRQMVFCVSVIFTKNVHDGIVKKTRNLDSIFQTYPRRQTSLVAVEIN